MVKIISVFVLLIQSDSVFSLTSDDFYKDPDPISTTSQEYSDTNCDKVVTVPLLSNISNILGDSMSTQFDEIIVRIIMPDKLMAICILLSPHYDRYWKMD